MIRRQKKENYNETLKCINKADILIMEISGHSMSMGYILSKALEINKPVIAMYKEDMEPVFIAGMDDPKLILAKYTPVNIEKTIWESIKKAKSLIDVRFNFFCIPKNFDLFRLGRTKKNDSKIGVFEKFD